MDRYYKNFIIRKIKNGYEVYLLNGICIRTCKTLKEIIYRIDTQTI